MKKKLLSILGWRMSRIDKHLVNVFSSRLGSGGISDWVAAAKAKDKSSPNRDNIEEQRLSMITKWAEEVGLNPNFATTVMYASIMESFRRQSKVTYEHLSVIDLNIDDDAEKRYAFHRQELLHLTNDVAPYYDEQYGKQFGLKVYLDFERNKIKELVTSIAKPILAVDLGCATGEIAFSLATQFENVLGYDISPHMINQAISKFETKTGLFKNVNFEVIDLDLGIPLVDNSVSAVIMNMGTASDIRNIDYLLEEIKRILVPRGKFLLSFYNSESLFAKFGFLPWPTSLRAMIDKEIGILDVSFNSKLYLIYAMPRNIGEVKSLLEKHGLGKNNKFFTHPTMSSILPDDIMSTETFESYQNPVEDKRYLIPNVKVEESNNAQKSLIELDYALSESSLSLGAYIIATGEKK